MEFELLLPEDEAVLDARTVALAQWCQGFLYGLGGSATQDVSRLPGEVGEVVRDLSEITRVGVDDDQSVGIERKRLCGAGVEFVRVGVQLVFEELGPLRCPALLSRSSSTLKELRGERRVRTPPPPTHAPDGARLHRHRAGGPGSAAQ